MKPKNINIPSDLIVGDYVFIVTWEKHKATPAKIEKVAVKEIFQPTYLNLMYGPGENGLGIEHDRKRWHFEGYDAWDLRKLNWEHEFPTFNSRGLHKLYHCDQLDEAERFTKVEVPKRQLAAVLERIDKIKQNFTSKITEMEELEKILTANCNAVEKEVV
jgi:hypothetical protein